MGQGMTVIGAPWFLSHLYPSSHVLGTVMVVTTAVNILFAPYAGALIDRHKRITLLRIENIVGAVALGAMALWGSIGGFSLVSVAATYLLTIMIFNLHFPATYALTQEAFPREWYGEISGFLEVITQTSAVVAGGLAGLILERFGLSMVFAIDSATYVVSFLFFARFRYTPRVGATPVKPRFIAEMKTAVAYLRRRPHFTITNLALYLPFVVLICLDMVHPFYVASELHAQAGVFSLMEGFYAAGATAAGLLMRRMSLRFGDHRAYSFAYVLFVGALAALATVTNVPLALIVMIGIGWSNAGIRVNRVTYVMHAVPTELIGRVNTFFNFAGMIFRTMLLLALTWAIDAVGTRWSYAGCAILLIASFLLYRREAAMPDDADIGGAPPVA